MHACVTRPARVMGSRIRHIEISGVFPVETSGSHTEVPVSTANTCHSLVFLLLFSVSFTCRLIRSAVHSRIEEHASLHSVSPTAASAASTASLHKLANGTQSSQYPCTLARKSIRSVACRAHCLACLFAATLVCSRLFCIETRHIHDRLPLEWPHSLREANGSVGETGKVS